MIQIAPMNEQNYKAVAAIEAECFSQPWSEKTFFEELSNPNAHTYLASENGEPAGFLSVWEVCGEVSVNNIAVLEKFRRRGIAVLKHSAHPPKVYRTTTGTNFQRECHNYHE